MIDTLVKWLKSERKEKTAAEYGFLLLVGSVYIYALARTILSATFIRIEPMAMFTMGVFSIVIFIFVCISPRTRAVGIVLFVLFGIYLWLTRYTITEQFSHSYEVIRMVTGGTPFRQDLGRTLVWWIMLGLGFFAVVFMLHPFNFWMVTLCGAAVMIITWGPGFTRDPTGFLLFLACFAVILFRQLNKSAQMSLTAIPLVALVVLLANGQLPHGEHEMFTRRALQAEGEGLMGRIGDWIFEIMNPVHFSFATTGFSGAGGRLGGPVTPNNRNVMTVAAPGRTYLAGATSNTFTGYSWIQTLQPGDIYTHGMSSGHFEMLYTMSQLVWTASHMSHSSAPVHAAHTPQADQRFIPPRMLHVLGVEFDGEFGLFRNYLHTYFPINSFTAAMGANRTGTIFRPPNAANLRFAYGTPNYLPHVQVLPTGDMQTPMFMSRGATYSMSFLDMDARVSVVEQMLQRAGQGAHQQWWPGQSSYGLAEFQEFLNKYTNQMGVNRVITTIRYDFPLEEILDGMATNVLAPYSQQVRQHFMQVPEITPQRVWDLTHEVIRGRYTDFERVMAIRDYLLLFPYTLQPGHVPDGVCFVDHFLFYEQRGYCTYFASAMAIMARIAGVPSRYVEGFVVPPGHDATVAITNRMAHAWVEVYLEGFGWHIVEATPTYAFMMDPEVPIGPRGGFDYGFYDEEWLYMMQRLMYEEMMRGGQGIPPGWAAFDRPDTPDEIYEEADETWFNPAFLLGIIPLLLLAFGAYVGIRAVRIRMAQNRTARLPANSQVKTYFRALLAIACTHTKKHLEYGETPLEYGKRQGGRFAFKSDSIFLRDLIALYYKARYAPREVTEDERALMQSCYEDMLELMHYMGRHRYFVRYYLRGIGNLTERKG